MTTNFDDARARIRYPLSFKRVQPRKFTQDMLYGPRLPNARGEGKSNGDWMAGDAPAENADVEQWWAHFAHMAVGEVVHEALEWLQVDDSLWLDPHGPAEFQIYNAVTEFCAKLAALRARCATEPDAIYLPRVASTDDEN